MLQPLLETIAGHSQPPTLLRLRQVKFIWSHTPQHPVMAHSLPTNRTPPVIFEVSMIGSTPIAQQPFIVFSSGSGEHCLSLVALTLSPPLTGQTAIESALEGQMAIDTVTAG